MHTTLSRSAHADPLEAGGREAARCAVPDGCARCREREAEDRAMRRDAVLHAIATVRPRRVGRRSPTW